MPRGILFTETDPAVAAAFEAALGRLSAAGARIVDTSIEDLLARLTEATAGRADRRASRPTRSTPMARREMAAFDPRVHARITRGRSMEAGTYIRMMRTAPG